MQENFTKTTEGEAPHPVQSTGEPKACLRRVGQGLGNWSAYQGWQMLTNDDKWWQMLCKSSAPRLRRGLRSNHKLRLYREWYNLRKVPSLPESEWKNICIECLSVFGHFFLASKSSVNGSYPPHSYSKESELHQKIYLIENMKTVQESTMCHKF